LIKKVEIDDDDDEESNQEVKYLYRAIASKKNVTFIGNLYPMDFELVNV